jgi:hypothetical protein
MADGYRDVPKEIYRDLFGLKLPESIRNLAAIVIQRRYRRWCASWYVPLCMAEDGQQIYVGAKVEARGQVSGSILTFEHYFEFVVERINLDYRGHPMGFFFALYDERNQFRACSKDVVRVVPPQQCAGCNNSYVNARMKYSRVCHNCWFNRDNNDGEPSLWTDLRRRMPADTLARIYDAIPDEIES